MVSETAFQGLRKVALYIFTGVHITLSERMSYSGEYQEMVFGTHPTHTNDLMKQTQFHKGESIFNTQFL